MVMMIVENEYVPMFVRVWIQGVNYRTKALILYCRDRVDCEIGCSRGRFDLLYVIGF